jgi:hypothetical protein
LQDAIEFRDVALARAVRTQLCTVDTKRHGTHYAFDHCNDELETVTVLVTTATFINDNLPV